SASSAPASKGEAALLSKAAAAEVDPDIRRKLYAGRQEAVPARLAREASARGNLNPWNHPEKHPILDATAEKKRIEAAMKEGQPITSDGVKEKSRKPKAPLEGIFN